MLSTRLTIIAFLAATLYGTSHGGVHYDVACQGVNNELECPPGEVIEVQSLHYGMEKDADCKDREKAARTFSTEDCLQNSMLGWVKLICDELERCRLPKPDARMFKCGYSEDTFLQITYECSRPRAGQRKIKTCEGETAEIKCENGDIKVVKASYGRFDDSTCMSDTDNRSTMTFCASYSADFKVKHMCDGQSECSVEVNSEELGTSVACDENPKYLTVDYVCQQ